MTNLSKDEKLSFIKANLADGLIAEDLMLQLTGNAFKKDQVTISSGESADISGPMVTINSFDDLFKMLGLPQSEKSDLPVMSDTYPCQAMVITASELTIQSDQVVALGSPDYPTIIIIPEITIEAGGQLKLNGNTAINSQVFTQN
ncbi:hypothetical protein [Mucilaginibacter sp. KACC 22063]|uniref:hypothetical protein n=1 Tax=Mucilaginibacter sp. KACC 22063 TaxID=3025666 RepID=UPI002366016B|nr:hypothetical protein [Mucilaginibacter sp. KACC 22063]WDF57252.1 hypothetical protein PQ461_09325 [Mucilaginibacter sp. KACC 22063]